MAYVINSSAVKYYPEEQGPHKMQRNSVCEVEGVAGTRVVTWLTAAEAVTYDLCNFFF